MHKYYCDPRVYELLANPIDCFWQKSMFDMHFEGTHSLVLYDSEDLMLRIYVTPPGKSHESHTNWSLPFLYHSHRYSFQSGPIIGTLLNEKVTILSDNVGEWRTYKFDSPMFNKKARINHIGYANLKSLGFEYLNPGERYRMWPNEIHRVGFIPDRKTDWSVVLFYEFQDEKLDNGLCYSKHSIKNLKCFGNLYNKPTHKKLDKLRLDLLKQLAG